MTNRLNEMLLKIGKCMGLEIVILPGDELLLSGVVLRLENNKVRKEKEFHFLTTYDALIRKYGNRLPVAVTVTGKGILQKKLSPAQLNEGHPLQTVLPNANPNDLYVSVTRLETIGSIAVARKEVVDKLLQDLKGHGLHVLSLSIGMEDLLNVIPFVTFHREMTLQTPQFALQLNDGRQVIDIDYTAGWEPATYEKIEYNIGDQYVSSPALMAFGAATGLLANGPAAPLAFPHELVLEEREQFTYTRYYKTSLWSLMSFVFVLLLVNFFFYEHYFSLNKDKEDSRQISRESEKKIQKQLTYLQSREDFLGKYGWEQTSRLSLYADRIAGLVPSGTVLTDLWLNPVSASLLGEGQNVDFKKDTIQVSGTCDDPTELNQFTNNLRNIQRFKEVSVRSYNYKKELGSGAFFMEIITK